MHRSSRAVASFLEEETKSAPLYDLTDKDSVRHVLWEIKRKGEIGRIFSKIPALYIADGHHRSEAAFRLKDKSHYFPAVVFSEEDVVVYEYHFNGEKEKRPLSRYTIKDIMECADKKEIMPPKPYPSFMISFINSCKGISLGYLSNISEHKIILLFSPKKKV